MPESSRPPPPGRFAQPNFLAIEQSLADVTFPIDKRELMREVEGKTVLVSGQNLDLRELVKDLNDDYFDNMGEVHVALERAFEEQFNMDLGDENAPVQPGAAWNDPDFGKQRGAADFAEYMDTNPGDTQSR